MNPVWIYIYICFLLYPSCLRTPDLLAELGWWDMRLDKLAVVVARRAGPTLRGLVQRMHDAQGGWVCALDRVELLAQEYVRFGNCVRFVGSASA